MTAMLTGLSRAHMTVSMLIRMSLKRFVADTCAAVALEFAFVLPLLALLMGGIVEINHGLHAGKKAALIAYVMADAISQNAKTTLAYSDFNTVYYAIPLLFPEILHDATANNTTWPNIMSVEVSYIDFPTATSCSTASCAKLKWDVEIDPSGLITSKSCSQTFAYAASASALPTATTLPPSLTGPAGYIQVTIAYKYHAFLFSNILADKTLYRASYLTPRYVASIGLDSASLSQYPATGTVCP